MHYQSSQGLQSTSDISKLLIILISEAFFCLEENIWILYSTSDSLVSEEEEARSSPTKVYSPLQISTDFFCSEDNSPNISLEVIVG